jgi:prepilin-type N-terminal cleavage/methylation domain-containing protein
MITKPLAIVTARRARRGFTLAEVLVSVFVLVIILLMVAQLMNSATGIIRPGNKHIDTDTEARAVFDRMAMDFGRMLKRTDIDYFLKQNDPARYPGHSGGHSRGHRGSPGQQLNDQLAVFTQVPGYYPSGAASPISLVAYRVNNASNSPASYFKLQRMSKGLLWNGASNATTGNNAVYPIVFLPQTIAGIPPWEAAVRNDNNPASRDTDYETIGPGVFRFEYYYILKNGKLSGNPWNDDPTITPVHTLADFPADVEAIAVAIAVIDPASRSLLSDQNLFDLASDMTDFTDQRGRGPVRTGVIEEQWNTVVTDAVSDGSIPPAAASAIRIYSRYFDLKTL